MRVLLISALLALTPAVATAQDRMLPTGVVRLDSEAVRQQTFTDQVACRDGAKAQARTDNYNLVVPLNPVAMVASLTIASVMDTSLAQRRMHDRIEACMTKRGYTPAVATADDEARFKAVAASGKTDPYASIVRFAPSLGRGMTVQTSVDRWGGETRTFTVGRF